MPSFYPRSMGRQQHPLTPPEYQTPYSASGYGSMAYQAGSYAALPAPSYKAEATYDYADRRLTYQPSLPSMVYPQQPAYGHTAGSTAQAQYFGAKMAPILPPLIPSQPPNYSHSLATDGTYRQRQNVPAQQEQAAAKAEKAVGGVAVKLDYDMETMTDFVAEMAHGIVQPRTQHVESSFRKWVNQVLCATRLPMATILLSLQYLQMRMTQITDSERYSAPDQRQRLLIVALILGSKFCDDNTFINRSWSEVSGIEVKILNHMEIKWFEAMDHRLHRDENEQGGWYTWHKHWVKYEGEHKARRTAENLKLSPIDTNVAYKAPGSSWTSGALASAKPASSARTQTQYESMQYDTPTYTPYDSAWFPRAATDNSPASAPHTGPTTPEYYGNNGAAQANWYAGHEGYSRRTMFGIPSTQPCMAQPAQPAYPMQSHYTAYTAGPQLPQLNLPYMNGHQLGCLCYQCAKSPTNFYLTHHPFGQAMSVAG